MDIDPALIRIKLFMATILTEITAMQVSLGRKIKSNGPDLRNVCSALPQTCFLFLIAVCIDL